MPKEEILLLSLVVPQVETAKTAHPGPGVPGHLEDRVLDGSVPARAVPEPGQQGFGIALLKEYVARFLFS